MKNKFLNRSIILRNLLVIFIMACLSVIPLCFLKSILDRGVCSTQKLDSLENLYSIDSSKIAEFENQRLYCTGYNTVSDSKVNGTYYFFNINGRYMLCLIKTGITNTGTAYIDGVSAKGLIKESGAQEKELLELLAARLGYDKKAFAGLYEKYVFVSIPEEEINHMHRHIYILAGISALFWLLILSRLVFIIFPRLSPDYEAFSKFSNPQEISGKIDAAYKGRAYGNNPLVVTETLIGAASLKKACIYDINDLLWAYEVDSGDDNVKKIRMYLFFNDGGIYTYRMKKSFVKQAMFIIRQSKSVITYYDTELAFLRKKSLNDFIEGCEKKSRPANADNDGVTPTGEA